MASTNKFIYVKQNFAYSVEPETTKVLVNPNFNKKVFVNPNFNGNRNIVPPTQHPKIHVNPNAHNINLKTDTYRNLNKILINPNVLRNIPVSTSNTITNGIDGNPKISKVAYGQNIEANRAIISTRTKLVRSKGRNVSDNKIKKRRSSIRSQFKIIKSCLLEKPTSKDLNSKFNLIKSNSKYVHYSKDPKLMANKFKLDNRSNKKVEVTPRNKKFVYVSRFLNISDIARNNLLKQNKKCKISRYCLKRMSNTYKETNTSSIKKIHGNPICKSKYKFIRKLSNISVISNQTLKQSKSPTHKLKKGRNTSKLRVCNIPCPYYRKFGRCKGKENGKCVRKHDPDQIALCTKFLQGACIDEKCLLSHNVSPEKMPTCKFYLEGSCSRDNCPYLHVRISPKADVCKDFLEGFCKKAAGCDKRHQFLCPDYEKSGSCLKQRCPYPHGKMVRKYSVFNKNKFAKKSSNNCMTKIKIDTVVACDKTMKSENKSAVQNCTGTVKPRYYIGQNRSDNEEFNNNSNINQSKNNQECTKSRPKLGKLPSFIAFENIS